MDVREVLAQARDAMTVKRVFGDPVERDGVTVIPVARVWGGGGGGGGSATSPGPEEGSAGAEKSTGREEGSGAGFGLHASPAGVYVIRGETVSWEPALDLNRVILGGQLVAVVLILAIRSVARARARHRSTGE